MHVTRIPFGLQKQNKDFQTFRNRQIRWCIVLFDLSLPSLSNGLIETCVLFFVACVILQITFKFRLYSMHMQIGFLLRWSHMTSEL